MAALIARSQVVIEFSVPDATLANAALCAERVGITLEERDETFGNAASPGWRWVEAVLGENNRRRLSPDKLLDKLQRQIERYRDKRTVERRRAAQSPPPIESIELRDI